MHLILFNSVSSWTLRKLSFTPSHSLILLEVTYHEGFHTMQQLYAEEVYSNQAAVSFYKLKNPHTF